MKRLQSNGAERRRGGVAALGLWSLAGLAIVGAGFMMVQPAPSTVLRPAAVVATQAAPFGVTGEVDQSRPLVERLDHSGITDTRIATDAETTAQSIGVYGP